MNLKKKINMEQVSATQLKQWLKDDPELFLLDVREPDEHAAFNIGGTNIPVGSLGAYTGSLPREADIVVYCAHGIRSIIAIQKLQAAGFRRLYNLAGGVATWPSEE